jgi:hypothetical protein
MLERTPSACQIESSFGRTPTNGVVSTGTAVTPRCWRKIESSELPDEQLPQSATPRRTNAPSPSRTIRSSSAGVSGRLGSFFDQISDVDTPR